MAVLLPALAFAQTPGSNLRRIQVELNTDSLCLDTLGIIPGSAAVYLGTELLGSRYRFDYKRGMLYTDSSLRGRRLLVYYRVQNLPPARYYSRKSKDLIEPVFKTEPRAFYNYKPASADSRSLFSSNMNVNGNIARGVGFGNNQDVVLNSNLNLQMNGSLGNGFSILAAISDENNPIQPEGNTQQIQDFDKVFITVYKDSNTLTLGDFLMQTGRETYFMKYYKKSRGLQIQYRSGKAVKQISRASAAVSRGKFSRNEIQGLEGIQGPYRLNGANGELNIIVISGTESVYLDGEKLQRGQQNDYVIDYNTGEITFMPGRLINRYNRIVAEFQYSDRNYSRSVFTAGHTIGKGRWGAAFNYFSEQDNRFQPADTTGRESIQTLLENAGDAAAAYRYERRFSVLQPDRVNYRKTDTLTYGPVYVFTNDPASDTAFYTVTFAYAGKGKGDYIQIASSANGRVFAWVQPTGNQKNGDYSPEVPLVAPKRFQMLSAGGTYTDRDKLEIKAEAAYTNNNQNTFSALDKQNDDGLGLFFNLKQKGFAYKQLRLGTQLKMEYVNRNFAYVERYRDVEFSRIWNRQLSNSTLLTRPGHELILNAGAVLEFSLKHKLALELSNYGKGDFFNAYRGILNYAYKGRFLNLSALSERLQSSLTDAVAVSGNRTLSNRADAVYTRDRIRLTMSGVSEESRFSADTSQNLERSSFRYEMVSAALKYTIDKQLDFKLEGSYRSDYQPQSKQFSYFSGGTNLSASLEQTDKYRNMLKYTGSYRRLNQAGASSDDDVLLSRLEYNAVFFKKVLQSSTYYQIGTGREQKRQFSYAPVQSGNGTHTWVDYNSNGIEELNEFEPAVFKDQARYVKIYLPTNEFIQSNTNEFNQTLRLQAPQSWQGGSWKKRFLQRFVTTTSYKADRRITDNRIQVVLNPFLLDVGDTSLISVNSLVKQTTFFNRSNPRFGAEHNIQTGKGKQFLNSGFEWKQYDRQHLSLRFGFSKKFNLVLDAEESRKQNRNNFFENRNYNYRTRRLQPELFFQTVRGLRIGTFYKYTEGFNAPEYGGENAYIGETGMELRYFIINKGNLDAKISSYNISYSGNANSPLAFDLLNGLSNGRNLTWNLSFGGKTKGNIQINITYEGRRTQVYKTVHTGRAEARYIF